MPLSDLRLLSGSIDGWGGRCVVFIDAIFGHSLGPGAESRETFTQNLSVKNVKNVRQGGKEIPPDSLLCFTSLLYLGVAVSHISLSPSLSLSLSLSLSHMQMHAMRNRNDTRKFP